MQYYDAHLHITQCDKKQILALKDFAQHNSYSCMTSLHTLYDIKELFRLEAKGLLPECKKSFGILPQEPKLELLPILESLAQNHSIDAVGECGFDFFTSKLKANEKLQEKAFIKQVEISIKYSLPLVLHIRKAMHKVFEYSEKLKQVPCVIFHSFQGSLIEAKSIVKRKINARFSFGKTLLSHSARAIECVKNLPSDIVCLETDAPYAMSPLDIQLVYSTLASIK